VVSGIILLVVVDGCRGCLLFTRHLTSSHDDDDVIIRVEGLDAGYDDVAILET